MERIGSISVIEKLMQPSHPSNELRTTSGVRVRQALLMTHLAEMCLNRGEPMDPIRLGSFSKALVERFENDADSIEAMRLYGIKEREEYEARIPDLGKMLRLVLDVDCVRRTKAAKLAQLAEEENYRRRLAECPHEFFSVSELYEEYAAKQTKGSKA